MWTKECRAKAGPGTWRPASLTSGDVVFIKSTLGVIAGIRALDYYTVGPAIRLGGVESLMPYSAWSVLFLIVFTLIIGGIATRWHTSVWLGHSLGAALYASLALAQAQAAFGLVPPDDYRKVGPLLVVALMHAMFAARSGPRPIQSQEEHVVEAHVAGDGA